MYEVFKIWETDHLQYKVLHFFITFHPHESDSFQNHLHRENITSRIFTKASLNKRHFGVGQIKMMQKRLGFCAQCFCLRIFQSQEEQTIHNLYLVLKIYISKKFLHTLIVKIL